MNKRVVRQLAIELEHAQKKANKRREKMLSNLCMQMKIFWLIEKSIVKEKKERNREYVPIFPFSYPYLLETCFSESFISLPFVSFTRYPGAPKVMIRKKKVFIPPFRF